MRLIFLGPPGAGKGTQAEELLQRLKISRISTGEILRQNVKDETSIGRKAKRYMEQGQLVPDEVVIQMTVERIAQDAKKGFVLDGFPRTLEQARRLDESLNELGSAIDLVINFETSESTIVERLSGRRICRKCGANYHIDNIPPRKVGICDRCGGRLYQRTDDKPETIKKRLEVYRKSSSGLINYYRSRGILETVSGDLDVERGYEALVKKLRERGIL